MARAKKKRAPARRKKKAAKKQAPFDPKRWVEDHPAVLTPITKARAVSLIRQWCETKKAPPGPTRKDAEARLPSPGSVLPIKLRQGGEVKVLNLRGKYHQLEKLTKAEAKTVLMDTHGVELPADTRPGTYYPLEGGVRLAPLNLSGSVSYYLLVPVSREDVVDTIHKSLPRPLAVPKCDAEKMLPKKDQAMVFGTGKNKFSIERYGSKYLLGEW